MLFQNGKDCLCLIWKPERSRKQYIVGQLTKNGQYKFECTNGRNGNGTAANDYL